MEDPKKPAKSTNKEAEGPQKLLVMLVVGFSMILLGIIILTLAVMLSSRSSTSLGAVIFIGPIPIVIGAGPEATWLILFSTILAVLSIIMFLIMRRQAERVSA
jgi:uncharacterized membrane protein